MNKKITISIVLVLIVSIVSFWFFNQRRSDLTDDLRAALSSEGSGILLKSDFKSEIESFYSNRDYLEVWLFNGSLSSTGKELVAAIEESRYDGLQPDDYNLSQIYALASNPEKENKKFRNLSVDEKVNLELLMTEGFLELANDLVYGKVNPSDLDANWKFEREESHIDLVDLLTEVANGSEVSKTIEKLYPSLPLYSLGRKSIEKLYETKRNDTLTWEFKSVEGSLKVGENHESIPALRKRLIFWDFLGTEEFENPLIFDSTMFIGLKKYQESNGMNPDGVIGSLVAESLNKSPQDLIDIASINMERLRWMPAFDWEQEMVLVNVANYQLDYLIKADTAFTAKVIVGKEYNESPTFTAMMSYIAFSPYWNIPASITQEEIIPAVRKDKNYLSKKNMEVVETSGNPVNENKIDWSNKNSEDFPYLIRQKPGGDNSLGLVKFMFPNEYNIYIHDTPARILFDKETRALSHGCIRIQNPDQFAKVLLNDKSWDDEKIKTAMNQDNEQIVKLDREIPVVILYMTFWAGEDGSANFRSDVYNRDEALLNALKRNNSRLAKN